MTLAEKIFSCFKGNDSFTLQDAYNSYSNEAETTIRARIYDNLGIMFQKVARGVYCTIESEDEKCMVIEGDGRDLSCFEDGSIDCILTDHPWLDKKQKSFQKRYASIYMRLKSKDH